MSILPVSDFDDNTPLYPNLPNQLHDAAFSCDKVTVRKTIGEAVDAIRVLDDKRVQLVYENDKLGYKCEELTTKNKNLVQENNELYEQVTELQKILEQQKAKFAKQHEELVIQEKAIQKVTRQLQQQAFNPKCTNKVNRVRQLLSLPKRPLLCHKHQNVYQLPKHPRFGVQLLSVKKNAF
jgi:vacuolar-type H+-ATPase subunit I/STV1